MGQLVRQGKKNPGLRHYAATLVGSLEPKAWLAEIRTVFETVRDNVRYTLDINNVETLQTPVFTLQHGYGDCDDMAVLIATLLESIGHPTAFEAISFGGGEFSHVVPLTRAGGEGRWITLDATEPEPMGWRPPGIRHSMIFYN